MESKELAALIKVYFFKLDEKYGKQNKKSPMFAYGE